MSRRIRLRTAAWYGDRPLTLTFPDRWEVVVHRPRTPPPLGHEQLAESFARPVGQPPIAQLARGRTRPLIIVDDLTRPTPAAAVVPFVLRQLEAAGIAAGQVRVLLARGGHGLTPADALLKKVGEEAARACRLMIHDFDRDLVWVGRSSHGIPVLVNREVMTSDFLVGVGGVYPQHSTGFGGGSKLALGVLGRRSIIGLHYGHPSVEGSYDVDNEFRRDLDEVARMIGLRTVASLHVDAERRPVRVVSGDPEAYYRDAVAFSRQAYLAPLPRRADVVVANAYPMDVSLTFARSKGLAPLQHAPTGASTVLIAASSEGLGLHRIFPFVNGPRFSEQRHLARKLIWGGPRILPAKVAGRVKRRWQALRQPAQTNGPNHPLWLYQPVEAGSPLPEGLPEFGRVRGWAEVLERVTREQAGREQVRVEVYGCSPLQVLDLSSAAAVPEELSAAGG